MTEKPLLLIDVDGPLNPYANSNNQLRKGKQFHMYKLLNFKVWLNPWHGEELSRLADRYELTWCTTWEHDANSLIGPRIGLPELPVIEFPQELSNHDTRIYFKTPTVVEYAAGRPFAWVDDEITIRDTSYIAEHHAGQALLHRVSPDVGLAQEDFDTLREWAA